MLTNPLRKHVLFDLQPYVCVVTHCAFSGNPFTDRRAWSHHLDLEHGFDDPLKNLECPLCLEHLVGHEKLPHLARHLEEISLTILPANAEESDDNRSDADEWDDVESVYARSDVDSEDEPEEDELTGELENPDGSGDNAATGSTQPSREFVCQICGAVKDSLDKFK